MPILGRVLDTANELLSAMPVATIIVDHMGRVSSANPAFEDLFGASKQSTLRCGWRNYLDADEQCKLIEAWRSGREYGQINVDLVVKPEFGGTILSLKARPMTEDLNYWVVSLENITGLRWQAEHQLHLQRFSEKLADASPDVFYLYNVIEQRTVWCNTRISDLGFSADEVQSQPGILARCVDAEDLARVVDHHAKLVEAQDDEIHELEYRWVRPDGRVLWLHSRDQVFERTTEGKVKTIVGSAVDISSRKEYEGMMEMYMMQAQEQRVELEMSKDMLEGANQKLAEVNAKLEELSLTDALTGLRNRRSLNDYLARQFEQSARYGHVLSLIVLDVDKFKAFNDNFGHQAGDEILKAVGKILGETARATDFVARYGGEEFVVVLPECGMEAASKAAERLRKAIEAAEWPYRPVTASFGYSSTVTARNVEELFAQADEALYEAKEGGRNQCRPYSAKSEVAA
jgi:diguanylate cyclase (GGDEF)-like protein/PAS domain S-box-containing protein